MRDDSKSDEYGDASFVDHHEITWYGKHLENLSGEWLEELLRSQCSLPGAFDVTLSAFGITTAILMLEWLEAKGHLRSEDRQLLALLKQHQTLVGRPLGRRSDIRGRAAFYLEKLVGKFNVRRARLSDARAAFEWRQYPSIPLASSEGEAWEKHVRSFGAALNDRDARLYVVRTTQMQSAGLGHFSLLENDRARIELFLNPAARGRELDKEILCAVIAAFEEDVGLGMLLEAEINGSDHSLLEVYEFSGFRPAARIGEALVLERRSGESAVRS